jgi:NADP-dependent 3-hydroxy acid dehydrogenase YdfG
MNRAEQKTVIVTGASSGIGQAIASHLDRKVWRVFATMRRPDLERDGLDALKLDVTSDESVEAAVDLPPKKWTGLSRSTLHIGWADVSQG